jgi:steroid 5-alpha reductase family enzyme
MAANEERRHHKQQQVLLLDSGLWRYSRHPK